jgi:hypothetical protein
LGAILGGEAITQEGAADFRIPVSRVYKRIDTEIYAYKKAEGGIRQYL